VLDLLGNGIKPNIRRRANLFNCRGHDSSKGKKVDWDDNGESTAESLKLNEKQEVAEQI
jgi:hypothetical protein